jgi:pilus assembly protein CpaC
MSRQNILRSTGIALLAVLGFTALPAGAATDTVVTSRLSTETVRMIEGHSVVLDTQVPLRRIYVGNPAVLMTYTSSPTEIVLTGKATGTSSLMVWDANGSSKLYTVKVDLDSDSVEEALHMEYPKEAIVATVEQDHISLSGNVSTKEIADGALRLAGTYSKQVMSSLQVTGHPREVRLKVRIAEVDRTKLAQFGVNLLSAGKNIASSSTQQFNSTSISSITSGVAGAAASTSINVTNPLNFFIYNSEYNVGLSVADLAQHNVLQILAEPTLTAMSGQPASFLSGGEFPFPTVQASAGSTPVVTVSFRPYGIKVDFTPIVNPDGTIRLKVAPEVSSLDYSNAVEISGYSIPALATRRAQTDVELRSGQSFAISGLLDHQTTESFARTPGIASIPILGELFKSKNNSHSVTELVVIVTADLVDPMSPDLPAPVLPKMSVPNLEEEPFDAQVNKNKAANPNTNRDTGKATPAVNPATAPGTTPAVTAQTAPTPASQPAQTTQQPAAAQPATQAPQAEPTTPASPAPQVGQVSAPAPPVQMAMQQAAPQMSATPVATSSNTDATQTANQPLRLKIKSTNTQSN